MTAPAAIHPDGVFRFIERMLEVALSEKESPVTVRKTPGEYPNGYVVLTVTSEAGIDAWTYNLTHLAGHVRDGGDAIAQIVESYVATTRCSYHQDPVTQPS